MSNTNKPNATCAICGKPYVMCYSCGKDKKTIWKRFCDTAEHYKIYQLVHGYTTGLYTDAEALEKMKHIDMSDLEELRPNIKEILKKIIASGEHAAKPKRTVKKQTVAETEKTEPEKRVAEPVKQVAKPIAEPKPVVEPAQPSVQNPVQPSPVQNKVEVDNHAE